MRKREKKKEEIEGGDGGERLVTVEIGGRIRNTVSYFISRPSKKNVQGNLYDSAHQEKEKGIKRLAAAAAEQRQRQQHQKKEASKYVKRREKRALAHPFRSIIKATWAQP